MQEVAEVADQYPEGQMMHDVAGDDANDPVTSVKFWRIAIATLLFKKEAFLFNYALDYVGFEIPNKFVVGFGLDYDGEGRNYPDIYQLSIP